MGQLHLFVGGMSCRRCVREVTARLRDVPGVETISANPADASVRLRVHAVRRRPRRVHRHHLPAPTRRHQKRRQRWDSRPASQRRDAGASSRPTAGPSLTEGHVMSTTPSTAAAEAAAAGSPSASSPRPSSWSSWTPPSSASRCRRCSTTSASPRRASAGSSTPTSSRSVACCSSAAGSRTCSAPAASSAIGWVVLAAGSLIAGFAGNLPVELAGRAVQGAGSALIAPAALTLLFMTFGSSPKELTRALALYGAAAPAGGTAGVFLGGVLTQYASWPWVFFINVPLAVVVLAVTRSVMPAGMTRRGSLDLTSAATVTAGLAAVVFAVVRAPQAGWTSASTLPSASAGWRCWGCSSPCRRGCASRWCAWASSAHRTSPHPTPRSSCSVPPGSRCSSSSTCTCSRSSGWARSPAAPRCCR